MPAFDFPNPGTQGQEVTNPATGVTYTYNNGVWEVTSSSTTNAYATHAELIAEQDARELADNNLQNQIDALPEAFNPAPVYAALETESRTRQLADENLQQQIDGIDGSNVDLSNYYNKADIDQKFDDLETVKGSSGTYVLAGVSTTVASRPGDMYINNAIAKNITFISVADIDSNGNPRPVGTVGDQLELVSSFGFSYRYNITGAADGTSSVEYVTGHDGNDLFFDNTTFTLYVYPVQVGDYYTKAESDDRYVQKLDDEFNLQGDALLEFIESRRPATIMMDITDTAAWIGQAAPVADPQGRVGWHFENNGNKIQWTLWAQDTDAQTQFTIGDLRSSSIVLRNSGERYPYIQIYTRRKGDGQDAGSTYRSRFTYESLLDGSGLVKAAFVTNRLQNPLYSNLPHVITQDLGRLSVGPQEDDEVIKTVVIGTDSGASPGQYKFTVEQLVIDTTSELFVTELVAQAPADPNVAHMFYQDSSPGILGRVNGDLWFDSSTMRLLVWHQNAWVNPDREGD